MFRKKNRKCTLLPRTIIAPGNGALRVRVPIENAEDFALTLCFRRSVATDQGLHTRSLARIF